MTSNYLQKSEKELETLIHTIRIYSQYIGMGFCIEKCAKRHRTDGMEPTNQDSIRTRAENETYKYLGILKVDTIKRV